MEAKAIREFLFYQRDKSGFTDRSSCYLVSAAFDAAASSLLRQVAQHRKRASGSEVTQSANSMSVRASANSLQQIEELLMHGKRKEAVDLAISERLFAHALVISSSMDKDAWRMVVDRFLSDEVRPASADAVSGHLQGLQVAYSHLAGQGAASSESKASDNDEDSWLTSVPPVRDLFGSTCAPAASHAGWPLALAAVLSNRVSPDPTNLMAVGDGLMLRGRIDAAHCCYLLAPHHTAFGGADVSSARATLLGSSNPMADATYQRNLDVVIMTEIFEFALSLSPNAKNVEPFNGLPYLQAFRLMHAYQVAELGEKSKAQKYCEAITNTLKNGKPSPYYHPLLLRQLKELSQRLSGATALDASGSWVGKKMQRATLDGVWGALEGSFTKFIAGEEDANGSRQGPIDKSRPQVGPFSHYSAITPEATSRGVSRAHSTADFGQLAVSSPPSSRAPSALDFYGGRADSPGVGASSALNSRKTSIAGPITSGLRREASEMSSDYNYTQHGGFTSYAAADAPWSTAEGQETQDLVLDDFPRHTDQYTPSDQDMKTPMAPQFFSNIATPDTVDPYTPTSSSFGGSNNHPAVAFGSQSRGTDQQEEDDDDLGLSNSKGGKQEAEPKAEESAGRADNDAKKANEKAKDSEWSDRCVKRIPLSSGLAEDLKESTSSGWLGRWWGAPKKDEGPKAVKAHLGEEKAFYYDPELKRWVNKKVRQSIIISFVSLTLYLTTQ